MHKKLKQIVESIVKLGESAVPENLWTAHELLCDNIFSKNICLKPAAIPLIMPTIMALLQSENTQLQADGCFFITAITNTPSTKEKEYSQYTVAAIPKILALIYSSTIVVVDLAIGCIQNVAYDYPKEVFEIIKNKNGMDVLISHLESTSRNVSEATLKIFISLAAENSEISQFILNHEVLAHVNNLLNRVPSIKLYTTELITKVTKYPEQIDSVITADILSSILKFLNEGIEITQEIKIQSVKIVTNIVKFQPDYIPNLMEQNIISKLADNLGCK
uniref:Uncharacterized protein n=1 Tax=Panagrolaimus sp. ES5 TaxID=591445 RepID=A0AC34G9M5_9BILA